MADVQSTFSGIAGNLIERILQGSIIVFLSLICGLVIFGVLFFVRYLRQFDIVVEIKSLRGSGTFGEPIYKIVPDKGGMLFNKKDKRYDFKLLKERVILPPPPLECLELRSDGKNQIKIFQKSQDEYYYLFPDKIDLDTVVRKGKKIPIGTSSFNVVDGDISYWNTLRKRDNRKLFSAEDFITKILPYIGLFLMFVTIIFLTYIITDHWGEFSSAAQALKEASIALRDVSTASVTTSSSA